MSTNNRVVLVDFLRGFALMGIVLIHAVEHFDFFTKPEVNFIFSPEFDQKVIGMVFLLISGKAYSIFALMFGFSFYIQMNRQENKGVDFRGRFIWRLTILLAMGFIHSLLYKGDILHIYALLGFLLVALYKVDNKILIFTAILLALQIPLLINFILSLSNPDFKYSASFGAGLWIEANKIYADGSFLDVVKFNFWKGRQDVWGWTFYNGRYLQLVALFIAGLVIGRKGYFENAAIYRKKTGLWLVITLFIILLFTLVKNWGLNTLTTETQKTLFETIVKSYINLGYTAAIILFLIQVFLKFGNFIFINLLAGFGRMSLTNYITQAVVGVLLFYGYGFGLYRYLGSSWSLVYGFLFLALQISFSKIWLRNYKYGPLEWFWRMCTYTDFRIINKKT